MSTSVCEVSQTAPQVCLPPWLENPYRLVSLWDILKVFKANELVGSIGRLENACILLYDSKLNQSPVRSRLIDNVVKELGICQSICHDLGLQMTVLKIDRWLPPLQKGHGLSSNFISELADSVRREIPITMEDEYSGPRNSDQAIS